MRQHMGASDGSRGCHRTPCYKSTAVGATIVTTGGAILGLSVAPNNRLIFGINGVFTGPPRAPIPCVGAEAPPRPHDPPPAGEAAVASARRAEASASAKAGEMPPTSAPGLDPAQMTTRGIGPRSAPATVQAEAEKAAVAALEVEKKNNLLPKCWLPALQKSPKPAFARFNLDLTFDAQGMQIASGVNEDRSAPRSDVVGCIQNLTLRIPATGQVLRVMVPLEFP